jgi:hypothetical protein
MYCSSSTIRLLLIQWQRAKSQKTWIFINTILRVLDSFMPMLIFYVTCCRLRSINQICVLYTFNNTACHLSYSVTFSFFSFYINWSLRLMCFYDSKVTHISLSAFPNQSRKSLHLASLHVAQRGDSFLAPSRGIKYRRLKTLQNFGIQGSRCL